MGRTLALDIGTKRTGAAITDDLNITAQAVGMKHRTGYKSELSWVRELMGEYEIERIIVGHPINMNGSRGERALACESIARKLARDVCVEVILWDERLTTVEAEETLIKTGTSRKKRKQKVDQVAAQLILSSWLASDKEPTP
jgi:putative Holliday junction resolvase